MVCLLAHASDFFGRLDGRQSMLHSHGIWVEVSTISVSSICEWAHGVPEICQKLRYTWPHHTSRRNPRSAFCLRGNAGT
jgi:hypothetical protein